MFTGESSTERSALLTSLVEAEGVPYGREDSFKMSRGSLLTQRFLMGIRTEDVAAARILRWCDALGMPPRLQAEFARHLPEANMVGVGLEDSRDHGVYKTYLEFWDKVRLEVRRTGRINPLLLHLGFKWRAGGDGSDGRIARYVCFPRLSIHDTLSRMAQVYSGATAGTALDQATGIVRRAAVAAPTALFLYVETSEEGNSRTSFDINLYKSELTMGDIDPFLRDLARHYCLPDEQFLPLIDHIGPRLLGHLSGGLDRSGHDVTTLYYETRALEA
ncbi:MAG TPA: hypothetical protein VFV87_10900 [Pirellulaceae bacterium]|nr:hypothetical protein [Pirellulaceae bacterium]